MGKRRNEAQAMTLPEPERANDVIIARCRQEIEGRLKAKVRAMLLPYWKRKYRLAELGEGFHNPRHSDMILGAGSRIGRYAYIGMGFRSQGPIVVGDLAMLASGIEIVGADHLYDIVGTPTRLGFPSAARPVTVFGLDAWIGSRVTIMEGVRIGAGAVVGSGSLVTRDVEPYTIVGGVPAKLIRRRLDERGEASHIGMVESALVSADPAGNQ
ncbi:hypothetical protein BES08_11900 [Novosphingobium resinovorum]|uniref:Acetyltransferase n=1 Tax=Novosphingobium resinovorum TaxID=158500 RepID=A0A1D8A5I1_9SPHN|nr:hypothetical protein BES08_11900 [Novosphingobium resinovorum]